MNQFLAQILVVSVLFASSFVFADSIDLSGGKGWLNVSRPLTSKDLKNRVVLLDFWTSACINCQHIIPDLHFLEKKYGEKLLVIGVHSGKYDQEKEGSSLHDAVIRLDIDHPVVNDADFLIWKRFSVNAWPTLILFDPEGRQVLQVSGEGQREELDQGISRLLKNSPPSPPLPSLPLRTERVGSSLSSLSVLLYPGKIFFDSQTQLLWIADTGHHRVLVTGPDGGAYKVIGNGEADLKDGPAVEAAFFSPQGITSFEGKIYIADSGNHAIRSIDPRTFSVTTVLGNGSITYDRRGGKEGKDQGLNSPWDLCVAKNHIWIAMAGEHTLWSFDPKTRVGKSIFGSGAEGLLDGVGRSSAFAQPSGISCMEETLYIADSESSSIRIASLGDESVRTLVGRGLFAFGDRDGTFSSALLQHALGVTIGNEEAIYVTDTLNSKLKKMDLIKQSLQTIPLPNLKEPQGIGRGIVAGKETIFIANTNNHEILAYSPSRNEIKVIPLVKSEPTVSQAESTKDMTLRYAITLPEGYHLNLDAPSKINLQQGEKKESREIKTLLGVASYIGNFESGSGIVSGTIYYCSDKESGSEAVCKIRRFSEPHEFRQQEVSPLSLDFRVSDQ